MRTTFFLIFCIISPVLRGQSCQQDVFKMYSEMDTCEFRTAVHFLPESCQNTLYYYYLAEANFFCNALPETDSTTIFFIRECESESVIPSLILRAKAVFLISLLLEEYRRVKNKTQFNFWLTYHNRLIGEPKCTTSNASRIQMVYQYEIIRYKRANDLVPLATYLKKVKRLKSVSRREFRQFYSY